MYISIANTILNCLYILTSYMLLTPYPLSPEQIITITIFIATSTITSFSIWNLFVKNKKQYNYKRAIIIALLISLITPIVALCADFLRMLWYLVVIESMCPDYISCNTAAGSHNFLTAIHFTIANISAIIVISLTTCIVGMLILKKMMTKR